MDYNKLEIDERFKYWKDLYHKGEDELRKVRAELGLANAENTRLNTCIDALVFNLRHVQGNKK
jgi:hypothetical protein